MGTSFSTESLLVAQLNKLTGYEFRRNNDKAMGPNLRIVITPQGNLPVDRIWEGVAATLRKEKILHHQIDTHQGLVIAIREKDFREAAANLA